VDVTPEADQRTGGSRAERGRQGGQAEGSVGQHETLPLRGQCQTCGTRVGAASALGLRDVEAQHLRQSERCRVKARGFK